MNITRENLGAMKGNGTRAFKISIRSAGDNGVIREIVVIKDTMEELFGE